MRVATELFLFCLAILPVDGTVRVVVKMEYNASDGEIVVKYTKEREKLGKARSKAWSAVKLSVRAYAREPSEVNAEKVTMARQRVEELKGRDRRGGERSQSR